MRLFAGLDGGQTGTQAVVADERGVVLGHGAAPPADLVGEPPGSRRQTDALLTALARALSAAGLAADAPFESVVAGISGHEGDAPLPLPATHGRLTHDTVIAHAGAFAGAPGILVIAGTGSVVLAVDAGGATVRTGGWGYFFGDGGSALWLARRAVAAAMARADAGRPWAFGQTLPGLLAEPDLRGVQDGFARGRIGRPALAAVAPALLAAAATDERAAAICRAGAAALARDVARARWRLAGGDRLPVSYAGGCFESDTYRELFAHAITATHPGARIVAPRYGPAFGALLLAYREAGLATLPVPAAVVAP